MTDRSWGRTAFALAAILGVCRLGACTRGDSTRDLSLARPDAGAKVRKAAALPDATPAGRAAGPATPRATIRSCSLPPGAYRRYRQLAVGKDAADRAAVEAKYLEVFEAITQRFAEKQLQTLEACCRDARRDPLGSEFCSAASALAEHPNDATELAESMPRTASRIEASNAVDLILSSPTRPDPNPFALYFRRLWELAQGGDLRVIDGFMVMLEQSHGIFAELAELALCNVERKQPALFSAGELPARHPQSVAELVRRCPALLKFHESRR